MSEERQPYDGDDGDSETYQDDSRAVAWDTEAAVLGCILIDADNLDIAPDALKPSTFTYVPYGYIYAAMQAVRARGMGLDILTVRDELIRSGREGDIKHHGRSDGIPGWATLTTLLNDCPSSLRFPDYVSLLLRERAKQDAFALLNSAASQLAEGRDPDKVASDVVVRMSQISAHDGATHTQTLSAAVRESYSDTLDAAAGKVKFVKLGYPALDGLLETVSAPDMILVAARPGQGKTAFLASVAKNLADDGKKVLFFTLEMSNKQVAIRLLAQESGVSYGKQRTGKLSTEDWERLNSAVERLGQKDYPLVLNDLSAITGQQMRQALREIGGADLVMLDYIQLAGADGGGNKNNNRTVEIGVISHAIKAFAKDLNVPVICAAQMSRAVESRADGEPLLSDLREGGDLEQDADIVIFPKRSTDPKDFVTEFIVAKHRNGPVGRVKLVYVPERTRFESIART